MHAERHCKESASAYVGVGAVGLDDADVLLSSLCAVRSIKHHFAERAGSERQDRKEPTFTVKVAALMSAWAEFSSSASIYMHISRGEFTLGASEEEGKTRRTRK